MADRTREVTRRVAVYECDVHGEYEFLDPVDSPVCPECGRKLTYVTVYEE